VNALSGTSHRRMCERLMWLEPQWGHFMLMARIRRQTPRKIKRAGGRTGERAVVAPRFRVG
jgi:hypothetical protein